VVGSGHCPGRRRLAAQTFNRWGHLGVWERLLSLAQARGVALGMAGLTASEAVPRTLDGTSIRAHQKAAGAALKGGRKRSGTRARRSAARAAASARRRA
jgi:ABC-type histidine transport system ATPase subunit